VFSKNHAPIAKKAVLGENGHMDALTICFLCGVMLLLLAATLSVFVLRRYIDSGVDPAIVDTFRSRIRAWWVLFGSLVCAFWFGHLATTVLFFILSICALREYITLTPKSPVDHRTLFWIYVFFTPLQFIMVGVNPEWFHVGFGLLPYQIFSLLLPGYVFLVLPGFMAVSGDPKRFLERIAKLQLGLIVCVYCLSYVPALLTLDLPQPILPAESATAEMLEHGLEKPLIETLAPQDTVVVNLTSVPDESPTLPQTSFLSTLTVSGRHWRLLFFFIVIVQLGDVFQYLWSQASARHVVAPNINATRTWEGVFGGATTTALLGVSLWYFTPFPKWWEPGLIALVASLMGFVGNMTMSAIKRDRGVGGYGSLISGHGGILDRIDSLCFAAPVFYHLVWAFSR